MTTATQLITIDGPAGTGKSSVAQAIADRLGIIYFDTGASYRALTLLALEAQIDPAEDARLADLLAAFTFQIQRAGQGYRILTGVRDVTDAIRSPEVTRHVSAYAALPTVRERLVQIQRSFAVGQPAVFEGRDLGSVVFPHACLKIFLTASEEERALRRFRQLQKQLGPNAPSYDAILQDQRRRDHADSTRAHSPLIEPKEAVVIETSHLTIEEVVEVMERLWRERCEPAPAQ